MQCFTYYNISFYFSRVTVKFNVNESIDDSVLDVPESEQPGAEQVPDAPKVWISAVLDILGSSKLVRPNFLLNIHPLHY